MRSLWPSMESSPVDATATLAPLLAWSPCATSGMECKKLDVARTQLSSARSLLRTVTRYNRQLEAKLGGPRRPSSRSPWPAGVPVAVSRELVLRLRATFRVADVDGNGFVDRWELRRLLRLCGVVLDEDRLLALLDRLDLDGDGRVDYEEFLVAFAATAALRRRGSSRDNGGKTDVDRWCRSTTRSSATGPGATQGRPRTPRRAGTPAERPPAGARRARGEKDQGTHC